jgi:two-component system response regulator HydG
MGGWVMANATVPPMLRHPSDRPLQALIAQVDSDTCARLRSSLIQCGVEVYRADSNAEAQRWLQDRQPDLLFTDLCLLERSAHALLREVADLDPAPAVVVLTNLRANGTVPPCVQVGPLLFMPKPPDLEYLAQAIARRTLTPVATSSDGREAPDPGILFSSESPMAAVMDLVRRISLVDVPVLLVGESGTGKELLARAIHARSNRKEGPLVPLNCATLPEHLIESHLFGHVRGAFTGAVASHSGCFEQARDGILFLDEIGELSHGAQAALLRVLQDGTYRPVGSPRESQSNARLIAATHRDLDDSCELGRFRKDLYFRLTVVPVEVPPLRDRGPKDVRLLLDHFIRHYNSLYGTQVTGVLPEALGRLTSYPWPGNVRELQHLVQQLLIIKGSGWIEARDLPEHLSRGESPVIADALSSHVNELPNNGLDLPALVERVQVEYLTKALNRTRGNKAAAAALLGLKRTTLNQKLKRYGLV